MGKLLKELRKDVIKMHKISSERIEIKKQKWKRFRKKFERRGFSFKIACELIPVTQLRIWDMWELFLLAKEIPNGGTYLELGSKWGGSLRCVLRASQFINRKIDLITIECEPISRLLQFCNENKVRLIKDYSQNCADEIEDDSIDMLFIDNEHIYDQIISDLHNYWPKIKIGGIICGHDYEERFPGISKGVYEFFGSNYNVLPHSSVFVSYKDTTEVVRGDGPILANRVSKKVADDFI